MNYDDRVYFTAGDIVEIKQDVSDKPEMVVKSIDKMTLPVGGNKAALLGVTCIWFNKIGDLQSYRFNTKDLKHIEK